MFNLNWKFGAIVSQQEDDDEEEDDDEKFSARFRDFPKSIIPEPDGISTRSKRLYVHLGEILLINAV